eukprot:CAMPEP_0184478080 /NCGR_PEP_ID=MMETSP0113_2-20130426/194_1 /TAXON_ID=91329 /ORGANISM="Norrisiella sphaerica, Strain BC52" /LENGTH=806 /DNA_ID=CAMNT_0026855735 /DNA_START=115 /DNA_END=2535 /DNA_ORIENTATION=-
MLFLLRLPSSAEVMTHRWMIFFLILSATNVAGNVADDQNRDIPENTMMKNWDDEYYNQVIVQSGGVGIGLAVIFSFFMLLHLALWGYCGDWLRCGYFKYSQTSRSSLFYNTRNRWGVAVCGWVFFIVALAGVIAAGVSHSAVYQELDVTFTDAENVLYNVNELQCKGPVSELLKEGKTINEIKDMYGGLFEALGTCDEASIGTLIKRAREGTDKVYLPTLGLIDQMQALVPALQKTIDGVEQMQALAVGINQTVAGMDKLNLAVVSDLTALYASNGNFDGLLPNVADIPKPDATDKTASGIALREITEAKLSLSSANSRIAPVVATDLGQSAKGTVGVAYKDISTHADKLADQLMQNMGVIQERVEEVDEYHEQAEHVGYILKIVSSILFAIALAGLLSMLLGFHCVKQWPMMAGAYAIFAVTAWIFLFLGIALAGSMLLYDACGCEGDYSADGCMTMRTLIATNMGSKVAYIGENEYPIKPAVDQLLTCPIFGDGRVLDYYPNYTPTSNYIDLLGAHQEFNLTDESQGSMKQLSQSASSLSMTSEAQSASQNFRSAQAAIAQVDVGFEYNFSQDAGQYTFLFNELASNAAPSYYPANSFTPAENTQNLQRLGRLDVANKMLETTRNDLLQRKMLFLGTVDVLFNGTNELDAKLSASSAGLLTSVAGMQRLVDKVLEFNRESPCGMIGDGYSTVVVNDVCQKTYLSIEDVVPGTVTALVGILCGFFLLVVMRDCVKVRQGVKSVRSSERSSKDMPLEEGKVNSIAGSSRHPVERQQSSMVGSIQASRPATRAGSALTIQSGNIGNV